MSEHVVRYFRAMKGPKLEVYSVPWCWWQQPAAVRAEFRAWWRGHMQASRREIEAFLFELRKKYESQTQAARLDLAP